MGNRFEIIIVIIFCILQQYFGIQFFHVSLRHNYKNSFLQFSRVPVNELMTFFHASVEMKIIQKINSELTRVWNSAIRHDFCYQNAKRPDV